MPRHIDIYVDDVPLSSVGPYIVQQVYEDAPAMELTEGERPGRSGLFLLSRKRQTLKVAAEIAIRELYDLPARSAHQEQLTAWAYGLLNGQSGGKKLRLSSRPGRVLNACVTADPALGAVRDFTAVARAEFTAYEVPYWVSEIPRAWELTGSTGSANLIFPGTAPVPLLLEVAPASGTLTSLTLSLDGEEITFTGLSASSAAPLLIGRDALDNLSATVSGASVLSNRTAASADDLTALPGSRIFAFTANTAVTITARVYGRWR